MPIRTDSPRATATMVNNGTNTVSGSSSDAGVGSSKPISPSTVSGPSVLKRERHGAPMATDTVSRVGHRSVGAPASPNTVSDPGLDSRVGSREPISPSTVSGPSEGRRERGSSPMATDTVSRVGHRRVGAPASPSIVSGPSVVGRERNGALMAMDTVSRVEHRSVGAPSSPNTVSGPRLGSRVGNRAPISPSMVSGPSVGKRERNGAIVSLCTVSAAGIRSGGVRPSNNVRRSPDALMAMDTVSRVEYRSVGAPSSPNTVSGPRLGSRVGNRAPISPSIVSGPPVGKRERNGAIVSPCIVSAAGIRSGGVRPSNNVRRSPDIVNGVRSLAGGFEPRVLNMGASGITDGVRDERGAAGMAKGFRAERMHSEGSNTGGVAGTREAVVTAASGGPVPSKGGKKRPRTDTTGSSRDGRRKGLQGTPMKSCHGCNNLKGRVVGDALGLCRGRENVGGKEEPCQYWVCRSCLKKWQDAGDAEGNGENNAFICCWHTRGRCMFRRVRASAPMSALARSERAKTRTVKSSVFELPKPTKTPSSPVTAAAATLRGGTPVGPDVHATTYSVCTSNNGLRVAVIKDKDGKTFMCSRAACIRVEHLRRASELCGTDSALRVRCHHAQVVHRADQIASAIPVFRGGAEFERVLETLPAGSTNANTFQRIRERMSGAEEEGVPLLVRLGETGWFAVRDGLKFSRTVIGEWAHVKVCRNDSRVIIQCKANNGSPCGESSSTRSTGRCFHAAIVAVHMQTSDVEAPEMEAGHDDDVDGVD